MKQYTFTEQPSGLYFLTELGDPNPNPPEPTPAPTPSPTPTPTPGGVEIRPLPNPGATWPPFHVDAETTVAMLIPGAGEFQVGPRPETPTEMDCELTISPTPGDVNYYLNHPFTSPRGGLSYPYRQSNGASQGVKIRWGSEMAADIAKVYPGWYLNVRLTKTADVDALYSVR